MRPQGHSPRTLIRSLPDGGRFGGKRPWHLRRRPATTHRAGNGGDIHCSCVDGESSHRSPNRVPSRFLRRPDVWPYHAMGAPPLAHEPLPRGCSLRRTPQGRLTSPGSPASRPPPRESRVFAGIPSSGVIGSSDSFYSATLIFRPLPSVYPPGALPASLRPSLGDRGRP